MIVGQSLRSIARIIAQAQGARSVRFVVARDTVSDARQVQIAVDCLAEVGDTIVPSGVGKVSEFNARGKEVKRRDLPLIKKTIPQYRTWKDWHGNEHSGIQIRSIDVYPIEYVVAPLEKIFLINISGRQYITTRLMSLEESPQAILHLANLMLEFFGQFEIFDASKGEIAQIATHLLQWDILPPGKYPWKKAGEIVLPYLNNLRESVKGVIEHRMREITRHEPDFLATGRGGYEGYFVYGFSRFETYLLESVHLDNATYVFGDDWELLSSLTKEMILNGSYGYERIVHDKAWGRRIRGILSATA